MITSTFPAIVVKTGGRVVRHEIECTMSYDAGTDPLSVQMVFQAAGEESVVWHVGRDLLWQGSQSAAQVGVGDVKFRFLGAVDSKGIKLGAAVLVCLRNSGGHADIVLEQGPVTEFLDATTDEVMIGEEECDHHIDDLLQEILGS